MSKSPLNRIRVVQRLQFYLERQFLRGTSFQLLVVAALIGLISLMGGLLVLPLADAGGRLGDAVWWAFLRLSDPGYLGDDQGVWRRVVSTWLTVAGYVVFLGALVAIMTQALNARMRRLESGLTPVATRGHLVVLGWTSRTVPVLGEILQSEGRVQRLLGGRGTSRLRLVVLCDEVTPRHAQTLRDSPGIGKRARHIVLRSGKPLLIDDLLRVDCANAAAIIVPSGGAGSGLSADTASVKALLSLANLRGARGAGLPYVVAEVLDPHNVTVARRAYGGPLEVVSGTSIIARLMAQNLRNQGIARVYRELLTHGVGCGLFVREHPQLAGLRLGAVIGRFGRAVLCGVVRWQDGRFVPFLNAPDDFELRADDRLVFVAPEYEDTHEASAARAAAAALPVGVPAPRRDGPVPVPPALPGTCRILVLGWSRQVAALLGELAGYRGERFEVTVVSMVDTAARERAVVRLGTGMDCRHIEADYASEEALRRLQPARFDRILLASSERLVNGEEADTRTLFGCLLLDAVLDGASRHPQTLLELQDPENEPLIGTRADVMVSPRILAHIVAQVALRRELRAVFDALLTAGGPELVLRPAGDYAFTGIDTTFAELQTQVRSGGETLIGIRRGDGELRLDPPRDEPLGLTGDDGLLIMTNVSASGL